MKPLGKHKRQASQPIIDTGTGNTTLMNDIQMNDIQFILSRFLKDNEKSECTVLEKKAAKT